jgi:hypothetical protein
MRHGAVELISESIESAVTRRGGPSCPTRILGILFPQRYPRNQNQSAGGSVRKN